MALIILTLTGALHAEMPEWRARHVLDVSFDVTGGYVPIEASLAHDARWSYLGTPGGLFRLPARFAQGSVAELVAFAGDEIRNVYVEDGALWVLKSAAESSTGPATDHAFLRSLDGGLTFTPLDDGLEECLGGYCSFLSASQAVFQGETIFLNAGGNLLASRDGGPWVPLIGEIARQACYDPTFALSGNIVLVGGECPLDFAYVRRGVMREGFLEWEVPPTDSVTPDLENRNVQFIRVVADGGVVLAGIEGAILRSSDAGASWGYVLFHDIDDATAYPYVTQLLETRGGYLAGGFDKAGFRPWLAWSSDEGVTWTDVSHVVTADAAFDVLAFLHEDVDGRALAGLMDVDAGVVRIVELTTDAPRRRPVRR